MCGLKFTADPLVGASLLAMAVDQMMKR